MRQAGLFVEGCREAGLEQRKGAWWGAAEEIKRGCHEQLERHHRRNRVAGQAEDERVLAASENGGLAWTNGDGIEEKFGAEFLQHGLNKVVLAHGHAAREHEDVFFQPALDFDAEITDQIGG